MVLFRIDKDNKVNEMEKADHQNHGWALTWRSKRNQEFTQKNSYITTARCNLVSNKTREYYVWAYDTDEAINYARLLDKLAIRIPILSKVIFKEHV